MSLSFKLHAESSIEDFYQKVLEQIDFAKKTLEQNPEDIQSSLSKWSLHQQLEHLNVTGRSTPPRIQEALESSDSPPIWDSAKLLFKLFEIERYTETAPDFSIPKGVKVTKLLRTFDRLKTQVQELQPKLSEIQNHPGKQIHPILGPFSAREWLMFMAIHQHHHLKITMDILGDDSEK